MCFIVNTIEIFAFNSGGKETHPQTLFLIVVVFDSGYKGILLIKLHSQPSLVKMHAIFISIIPSVFNNFPLWTFLFMNNMKENFITNVNVIL